MEATNYLEITLALGSISSIIFIYVGLMVITFTLDKRLKVEFMKHPEIIPQETWFFRVICISLNVALKNRSKTDRIMKYHYQGFDFRSFATKFETFICLVTFSSFLTLLLVVILAYPLDYFNFTDLGLF